MSPAVAAGLAATVVETVPALTAGAEAAAAGLDTPVGAVTDVGAAGAAAVQPLTNTTAARDATHVRGIQHPCLVGMKRCALIRP